MSDDSVDPTYPAQAEWRVLRYVVLVIEQTLKDLSDPKMRAELRDALGLETPASEPLEPDLELRLVTRALYGLARELMLRADQSWDANVAFLQAYEEAAEQSARRN